MEKKIHHLNDNALITAYKVKITKDFQDQIGFLLDIKHSLTACTLEG